VSGNKSQSDSEDNDDFGPRPPKHSSQSQRLGVTVPTLEDLELRREEVREDALAHRDDIRYERKQDRKVQKERMEELVPRTDPGSRERQLEKRAAVSSVHASFKEGKDAGTEEVGEGTLMGDDGVDSYKAKVKAEQKKKSEREIRKEELWRARAEEREERLAEHRAKEDKTMEMLRAIAEQRFGGGA